MLQLVGAVFVRHQVQGAAATSGVFALVLGLLSWLFVQAQVTVLAAEVNVVRRERLWPRSLTGRNLTPGDQAALRRYAAVEQRIEGQAVNVGLTGRPPTGTAPDRTTSDRQRRGRTGEPHARRAEVSPAAGPLLGEALPQLQQGPTQDPGQVRLGHPDPLGDLGLGEVLEEPQVDDRLLPLGQVG